MRASEMMAASAHVISHRVSRRNSPAQLFSMGSEKWLAAMESSHAMTRHLLATRPASAEALLAQWPGLLASAMSPFHRRALSNARRTARRRARR